MAYVDKQPLSHRLANLGTAGLIELGIGVALVAGLSTTFVREPPVPQIAATNYPSEPPPTPEAQPTEQSDSIITVIEPPIKGELDASKVAQGCAFRSRCPFAIDRCATEIPVLRTVGQQVACHRAEEFPQSITSSPVTAPHKEIA